jgi:metallo-beta-lactamase class B
MSLPFHRVHYRPALRRFISATCLATVLFASRLQGAVSASSIAVEHLIGPIYVVEDSNYAAENSVFYVGPQSVSVIGTGYTPQIAGRIAAAIGKITPLPVADVVDTDYHPDRAGGNAYWHQIGAAVVATRRTEALLKSDWNKMGDFMRKAFPDYPRLPVSLPTKVYDGDFDLQSGHVKAFFLGPSHAPDDIFVYFPAEKVLYAGDILKEQIGNLESANLAEYPKTLGKLKELHLPIQYIISGHWSPVHGPELIDHYLALLRQVGLHKQ